MLHQIPPPAADATNAAQPLPLIPLDDAPPLPVARVGNGPAVAAGRAPLDLANAGIEDWSGGGSMMAVVADTGDSRWRVKSTGDSGCSAMEATLSKLFQLTGLAAPDTRVAEGCEALPGDNLHVASRYEASFQDLGAFLATPGCQSRVAAGDERAGQMYSEHRARHSMAVTACEGLLKRAGVEQFWQLRQPEWVAEHAAFDRQRFDALEAMNRMLPVELRCDQVRHFMASRWLDNWDHLNFRMENFGYVERDGRPVGMTVDFGSCGPLGFRNLRNGAMLPKQASRDIALLQRPPSLFPIPDAYAESAADFDAMEADPGQLHDTLRWPYGFQSDSVAAMLRPPMVPEPAIADVMAEMGYRLALLPASAIEAVVTASWQVPVDAPAASWPDTEQMVATLVQRRDAILQHYDPAQIAEWITIDPARAAEVQRQVVDGMHAAVGNEDAVLQELEATMMAAHRRLLDGVPAKPVAAAPEAGPVQVFNAVTARIRTLQHLHDCNRRMAAALDAGADDAIGALGEELLSSQVFGQLLQDLELGPGSQAAGQASFEANHAWLLLVNRLLQSGRIPAARVMHCLLAPFEGSAYPPNVGAHTQRDPALGMAFIELLETLMSTSAEVTPAVVRERLLTTKIDGFPNYYSALAASGASTAWDQRLQQAELLPDNAEYIRLRSLWSWAVKKLNYEPRRDNEPILLPQRAQRLAAMPLDELVQHVDSAYGPARVAELELPMLRENVYSTMALTSSEEDGAMRGLVARSINEAWRKAMAEHRLSQAIPVPAKVVDELQERTLRDYQQRMKALRRKSAEALIRCGEQRYRDAVLADATIPPSDRLRLLRQCADEVSADIRNMVRDAGGTGGVRIDTGPIERRVQGHAAATAAGIAARVKAEAQARAVEQVRGEARDSAAKAAATGAQGDARSIASTAARAMAAHAQAEARKATERHVADRAAKEASARAARDAIVQGRQFKNEVETRLAMLRSPDAPGSASSTSRQTTTRLEQRLGALKDDRLTAPLEERLRALREDRPPAGSSGAASRTRLHAKD